MKWESLKQWMKQLKDSGCEKQQIAHAIQFGRAHQSPLTGYFHYSFEDPTSRETIPLFENACFILALMRSHIANQVIEAKELLDRMLAFQTPLGSFPLYMHSYPKSEKPLASVAFLFPLFHIHKHYGHILGKQVLEKLEVALNKLYHFIGLLDLPPILQFQKEAFAYAFLGKEKPSIPGCAVTSKEYGDLLLGAELTGDVVEVPWHVDLKLFGGMLANELTYQFRPRKTLIDLALYPEEKVDLPIILLGALLFDRRVVPISPTGDLSFEKNWMIQALPHFKKEVAKYPPGFHLFRVAFNEHLLAFLDTSFEVKTIIDRNTLTCDFYYPMEIPDEKKSHYELALYVNHVPPLDIRVQGNKATVFSLGDEVTLGNQVALSFSLLEGEGRFLGHLMRANRPSQMSKEGYEVYDWALMIRSLERSAHCALRLTLRLV